MSAPRAVKQFRVDVVRPTLRYLEPLVPYSEAAENLLVGTAVHESGLDAFVQEGGPALGFYQIEPATLDDVNDNFLRYRAPLALKVADLAARQPGLAQQLVTNLAYATAIARVVYLRAPDALPDADDVEGLAAYWKRHYNTPLGRGTAAQWALHYRNFVDGGSA